MRLAALCACLLAGASAFAAESSKSHAESRMPDGSQFVFWEKPLTFTRTWYVDGGKSRGSDRGDGSRDHPFRTIGEAAHVLQPGERVVIAAGTYRETVRPVRGGTRPDRMISYEAEPGAKVIVKGSDVLGDGWEPSVEPMRNVDGAPPKLWKHALAGSLFIDAYNPFAMVNVPGDWSWLDTSRVDMGPYFRRRGLVFVDGKPLEPVEQYRELGNIPLYVPPPADAPARRTGLPGRSRRGPIMQEIGGSQDGRFWVEHQGNVIHLRVPGAEITGALVEITTREQAFAPLESGLGYIRIKGLTFQHAGNAFPPPQRGLVSTGGGHHWIIEGNTIEWASGVALDIGAQHWSGRRAQQSGESHVIRGNTIRYAGVEGIGGMGTNNTLVEDNLIEWVGWQDAERAWEAAGAKFHRARNLLFRRNVVRHIRHANAVWLDVGNSNSRLTSNVLADVLTVSAAIHMEMSLELNQIDRNIIWDVRNAEPGTPGQRGAGGSGIFLHASQGQLIANNLIGRCDNVGVFPALRPDREGSGNARGHRVHDNLFASCDKGGIVFAHDENSADGNVYASTPIDLPAWRAKGWDKNGRVAALDLALDVDRLEMKTGGTKSLPKSVGPFGKLVGESTRNVDPRR